MFAAFAFVMDSALLKLRRPSRRRRFETSAGPFEFVNPEGLRFVLVPGETVDRGIAFDGIFERRFLVFARSILPPGAVFVDVGANIGNHALHLHRSCAQVHCFEPNPRAFDRLELHIRLNAAHNIHVHRFGLGNRDDVLSFATNMRGNLGNSHFVETAQSADEGFEITQLPIRQADAAIGELNLDRLDLLKIDVEGLEEELFEGLRQTIARYRPIISFEHHGHLVAAGSFEAIIDCMPGYVVCEPIYNPDSGGFLRKLIYNVRQAGQPCLRLVMKPEKRSYENLVAIPREHPLFARVQGASRT